MKSIKKISIVIFSAFMACSLIFCGDALAGKKKKAQENFEKGKRNLWDSKYETAARFFDSAYKYNSKNIKALIYAGRAAFLAASTCGKCSKRENDSNYSHALINYKKALEKEPNNPLVHVLLGALYYEQDKDEETIKEIKKGFELGVIYDRLLKVETMDAHYFLGKTYYYLQKLDKALEEFKKVLATCRCTREHFEAEEKRLNVIYGNAWIQRWVNEYRTTPRCRMVEVWRKGMERSCTEPMKWQHIWRYRMAHWFVGNIYKKKGDYDKAHEYYQKAADMGLKIGGKYLANLNLDICKDLAKKNKGKVLPAITQKVRKYLIQAQAVRKDKRYKKAIEYYKQAIKEAPWYPGARFDLALTEAASKKYENAITQMKCFLALVPNHKNAQKAQEKIWGWEAKLK